MKCQRCGATVRLGACPRCLLAGDLEPIVLDGVLELEEEIGRGAMGSVWRARHRRLGRTVAVKLLPEELATRADLRARFEREARALSLLQHPHIVTVHDLGEAEGQPYMVLELVAGGSLRRAMPLPARRALEVARDVASALAYAHERGIVHRDVKPENILLDEQGRAKIGDFGIARLVEGGQGWTVTARGEVAGTPHYMAPEALGGASPDPRMDLYSLGVVLHELLTGTLPIGGNFKRPPAPADALVARALEADPARRYPDAAAMLADIEVALRSVSSAASAETTTTAAAELPADERSWVSAVALLQAVSTGVALLALVESIKPRVTREVSPLIEFAEPRPDGTFISWARFETGHVFAALGTFALAISAYAALRRHWREARLEVDRADRPVPGSRTVLGVGVLSLGLYLARKALLEGTRFSVYVPVVGGLVLVGLLFFFWTATLEAWRTRRPLRREPLLWLGLVLGCVPPVTDYLTYLVRWQP